MEGQKMKIFRQILEEVIKTRKLLEVQYAHQLYYGSLIDEMIKKQKKNVKL